MRFPELKTWTPLLLLAVVTGTGCRQSIPIDPPRSANVVLFLIDTLRADRLSVYGYDKPTAPNMEALAAQGVVFQQASAPAPWTLPSVTSLLLSAPPCEHKVLIDYDQIALSAEPLAARLKKAGYKTASFIGNPFAGPMTGLEKGYDVCQIERRLVNGELIAPWLSSVAQLPFFLYIHNTEPHNPYRSEERFVSELGEISQDTRERVEHSYRLYRRLTRVDFDDKQTPGTIDNTAKQDELMNRLQALRPQIDVLYDAAVLQSDENLGSVIRELEKDGTWDETLFILVSDHGEELGDHGGWLHDQSAYEELIRVPLIIRFPHDEFAGRRVNEPVSLLDVVPTIMDYLRRPTLAANCRGQSLMPLIEGEATSDDMRVTAGRHNKKKYYRPYKERRGDVNLVVRRGKWKGIWNAEMDSVELYDLQSDPQETTNVSTENEALAKTMRDFARSQLAACEAVAMEPVLGKQSDLDEQTRRQLESLGYVDSPARKK